MTAYALAHLLNPVQHPDVAEYIERIEATFAPYGGRFLVHGVQPEVIEGEWPGAVVVIGFPDLAAARAWYASPAYQAILPLRTDHIDGPVILLDGVPPGYDATRTATRMREALA